MAGWGLTFKTGKNILNLTNEYRKEYQENLLEAEKLKPSGVSYALKTRFNQRIFVSERPRERPLKN